MTPHNQVWVYTEKNHNMVGIYVQCICSISPIFKLPLFVVAFHLPVFYSFILHLHSAHSLFCELQWNICPPWIYPGYYFSMLPNWHVIASRIWWLLFSRCVSVMFDLYMHVFCFRCITDKSIGRDMHCTCKLTSTVGGEKHLVVKVID